MNDLVKYIPLNPYIPKNILFNGRRFGYTPGCWDISKAVAKRILNNHGYALPRIGYERVLDESGYNYIQNNADRFRIYLKGEVYEIQ